jgi:RNA polymerase sigma factor (sigma-70 family)
VTIADAYFENDIADATAAHKLEDEARAMVLALPGGPTALSTAMAAEPKGANKKPTRAPAARALRAAAGALPDAPRARGLLAMADEHYWRMVLRHDRFLMRETNLLAHTKDQNSPEWKDVHRDLQMGWFRAAMRWDPARALRFTTYAQAWGRNYVTIHRDRGSLTVYNSRAGHRIVPVVVHSTEEPVTAGYDDGRTFGDTIEAEDGTVEQMEARAGIALRFKLLGPYLMDLTEQQRRVLELRYGSRGERTLEEVGAELGMTRQGVSRHEAAALESIRRWLIRDGMITGS